MFAYNIGVDDHGSGCGRADSGITKKLYGFFSLNKYTIYFQFYNFIKMQMYLNL